MDAVDVVIISWAKNNNLFEVTKNTINTLFESETNVKFNVFVVESNKAVSYPNINITTIYPDVDYGYNRYLNIGRKAGKADYVCLCNNDLIFYKNWATEIIRVMKSDQDILSASPYCKQSHDISLSREINKFHVDENSGVFFGYAIKHYILGCCIFQRRSIYDLIGDMDENFIHWYADDDYANTLRTKDIKHALITSARVDHAVGATSKHINFSYEELRRLTTQQKDVFESKWLQKGFL